MVRRLMKDLRGGVANKGFDLGRGLGILLVCVRVVSRADAGIKPAGADRRC